MLHQLDHGYETPADLSTAQSTRPHHPGGLKTFRERELFLERRSSSNTMHDLNSIPLGHQSLLPLKRGTILSFSATAMSSLRTASPGEHSVQQGPFCATRNESRRTVDQQGHLPWPSLLPFRRALVQRTCRPTGSSRWHTAGVAYGQQRTRSGRPRQHRLYKKR